MINFSIDIYEKEKKLKDYFKHDETFIIKDVFSNVDNRLLCKIALINGLADPNIAGEIIVKPVICFDKVEEVITSANINKEDSFENAIDSILQGDALVLIPDVKEILIIDCKANIFRSVAEPSNEVAMKGPRDGFIENYLINISLIRKRLRNHNFKVKFLKLNEKDHGQIALVYVEDLVDQDVLKDIEERLNKNSDTLGIDVNLIAESIRDKKLSPFKTLGDTERPDFMAFKLLEGKVGIVVDGTPLSIYAPFYFMDNFKTVDDYYNNYTYASMNKILRILAFILTITVPALYISLLVYQQELLPTELALSIAASRKGVPLPTVFELVFLQLTFEILREASSKISAGLGTSLSIVGALILGQAAVEAKIISITVVIVVAITSLTGLMNPNASSSTSVCRFFLIILAAILGINGLIIGLVLIGLYVANIEVFGKNYIQEMFTFNLKKIKKSYFRLPKKRRSK